MKRNDVMNPKSIVNPYTGDAIERGRKVTCRMNINGMTTCEVDGEKHGLSVLIMIIGLAAVIFLFTAKLEITFGNGSTLDFSPSTIMRDTGIFIAILSVMLGILLGILCTARRFRR